MNERHITRRQLLKLAGTTSAALALGACQPKIVEVEKEVTKVVKEVVKETVVVEGTPQVVEKVVEKVVEATPAKSEPVQLRYMNRQGSMGEHFKAYIPDYEERFNAKVQVEDVPFGEIPLKAEAMHAAGTMVDVTFGAHHWYFQMAYHGVFVPLDDYIDAAPGFDLRDWFQWTIDTARLPDDGKLYCLPEACHAEPSTLLYNKDLFDQVGASYPTAEWTYDDLAIAAKAIFDKAGAFSQADTWICGWECPLRSWNARILSEDHSKTELNGDNSKALTQWLFDRIAEGSWPKPDVLEGGIYKMWLAGKVGMWITGCWIIPGITKTLEGGFKWGAEMNPKGSVPNGVHGCSGGWDFLGVWSGTKHKDLGWEFVRRMTELDIAIDKALLTDIEPGARIAAWEAPEIKETFPGFEPTLRMFRGGPDISKFDLVVPSNYRYQELSDAFDNEMQPIFAGTERNTKYLDEVADTLQKVCDKPKA